MLGGGYIWYWRSLQMVFLLGITMHYGVHKPTYSIGSHTSAAVTSGGKNCKQDLFQQWPPTWKTSSPIWRFHCHFMWGADCFFCCMTQWCSCFAFLLVTWIVKCLRHHHEPYPGCHTLSHISSTTWLPVSSGNCTVSSDNTWSNHRDLLLLPSVAVLSCLSVRLSVSLSLPPWIAVQTVSGWFAGHGASVGSFTVQCFHRSRHSRSVVVWWRGLSAVSPSLQKQLHRCIACEDWLDQICKGYSPTWLCW